MRILLCQSSVYVPAHGGANKSNRLLMEALALRGHECHVVAAALGVQAIDSRIQFREELRRRDIEILASTTEHDIFRLNDVTITAGFQSKSILAALASEIRAFDPHAILVASEDPGQFILKSAVHENAARVIYLARTTLLLPFGPASALPSKPGLDALRKTAGIVAASRYLSEYITLWGGLEATDLPLSPNGPGPFRQLGCFDSGCITIVNPCAYKGISIFAELARAFPDLPFGAVPTWGTTKQDYQVLAALPNVSLLKPTDEIDSILEQTRVLLVPSLWAEAKGNIIVEAMLRGIPVVGSDVGGTREAMNGMDFLVPVNPITRYLDRLDDRLLPVPVVPPQDLTPWRAALSLLTTSRDLYDQISLSARIAAERANECETVIPLESYLLQKFSPDR